MPEDYVSPVDERAIVPEPLAERPGEIAGSHIVLLDITKNRGDELLDHIGELVSANGGTVSRMSKEIFSRPASPDVIAEVSRRADLVVEALAD